MKGFAGLQGPYLFHGLKWYWATRTLLQHRRVFYRLVVRFCDIGAVVAYMLKMTDLFKDQQLHANFGIILCKPSLYKIGQVGPPGIDLLFKLVGFLHFSLCERPIHAVTHIVEELLDKVLVLSQLAIGLLIKLPVLLESFLTEHHQVVATVGDRFQFVHDTDQTVE